MKAWYGCELVNVNYKMALSLLKEDIARKRKAIADKKLEKARTVDIMTASLLWDVLE